MFAGESAAGPGLRPRYIAMIAGQSPAPPQVNNPIAPTPNSPPNDEEYHLFAGARQAKGSVSEPSLGCVDGDRRPVGGEECRAPGSDACPVAGFERSQAQFAGLVEWVAGEQALGLEHSELETRLVEDARALARQVLQDQLDLRARVEQRADEVIGADATPRRTVERGHERDLHTVLGEVQVTRLAYRAAGSENLYPADARLNLPPVRHSHGIRRLAALEAPR